MKIVVQGKTHRSGVSKKTGNAYDFNQIHYLGYERGVEGIGCHVQSLDPAIFPYTSIEIGKEYNLEFDGRGYVVDMSPVVHAPPVVHSPPAK